MGLMDVTELNAVEAAIYQDECAMDRGMLPDGLLEPVGLVGLMTRTITGTARRPQPLLSVAGALSTMSIASRNLFTVNGSTRLNTDLMVVGATGCGKDWPLKAPAMYLLPAGIEPHTFGSAPSSDTGLLRWVSECGSICLSLDEFGKTMSTAKNSNTGSHQFGMISEVMKFYSMAGDRHPGKRFANPNDTIPPIDHPFVNVLAASTPQALMEGLSSMHVVDGFLNRFMVFQTDTVPPIREPSKHSGKETVAKQLELLIRVGEHHANNRTTQPLPSRPFDIQLTDDATELLRTYSDDVADVRMLKPGTGALWSRARENSLKVAGLLTLGVATMDADTSTPFTGLAVDAEVMTYAIRLVTWTINSLSVEVTDNLADNEHHSKLNYIRKQIRDCSKLKNKTHQGFLSKGMLPRMILTKAFSKKGSAAEMDMLLNTLLEAGEISTVEMPVQSGHNMRLYSIAEN